LTTAKKTKLKITSLLLLGSLVTAHLCFGLVPAVFETWNAKSVDQLFVIRSSWELFRPAYNNTVVHVDLTNTSIRQLDNYYFNRSHFAKAVNNLSKMNVSAQVYDFILAARKNAANDQALINAVKQAGNAYFGLAFQMSPPKKTVEHSQKHSTENTYLAQTKWNVVVEGNADFFYSTAAPLMTFPELARACKGLGALNVKFDPDGVLRRVPLLMRYDGAYYPILPFKVICEYLNVLPENIIVKPGKHIILKEAQKPGHAVPDNILIPIDRHGNMIVNYVGPWERMDHYNIADILLASDDRDGLEMWRQELEGKIVIVSDVSTGSSDIGPVPTDHSFPFSGVQANIIHNILTDSFLRQLSKKEMLLIEVLLLIALFLLASRMASLYFSFGTLALALFYLVAAGAGFLYFHLVLHIVRPLLMVALALISIVIYRYMHEEKEKLEGLRQRDFIRATFGRYLSNEVVEELLGSPAGLKMSGESREVTFLVSDLRGFTALASELSPNDVIRNLNLYLESMVAIIGRYRGTVNEFQGDGVLVFFGAPIQNADDPHRAVSCAIEMQNALVKLNAVQRSQNLPEFSMGIGINSDEVVVGNIGSEKRAKYGAVGSPINMAFRIEAYTTGGQILISPDVYEKVQEQVQTRESIKVSFKGIDRAVELHDIVGIKGHYQLELAEKPSDRLSTLQSPVPITCFPLKGKIVADESIAGQIVRFGDFSAEVTLEGPLERHANLKVVLATSETERLPGIYAKVASLLQTNTDSETINLLLEFTWLPADVKQFLVKKCKDG